LKSARRLLLECGQGMMKVLTHIPHVWETRALRLTSRQIGRSSRTAMVFLVGLPLTVFGSIALHGQELQPQGPATTQPAAQAPVPGAPVQVSTAATTTTTLLSAPAQEPLIPGDLTEDYLKHMLVGKQLFLRGGYLGDSLSFTESGDPEGHPTVGSFTLSAIQIDQVHLSKHKVELEGSRYALHFLGAMPYEDDSRALDRVKITPKKKVLRISIAREETEKKKKESDSQKAAESQQVAQNAATAQESGTQSAAQQALKSTQPPALQSAPPKSAKEHSKEKAEEAQSVSAAHAAKKLHDALDKVFAQGMDDKFRAKLPEFWQLYFEAQAAGTDYRPKDPSILRSSAVDTQAKVLSSIAPESNEFAQANSIAGRAIYRVVIGADGTPSQIAVVRPIGFGLDENAVAAIRKATFAPAAKGGKPVSEALDLAVLFRIYSKRTSGTGADTASQGPIKPGPYSAGQTPVQQQP
jgi:TonB family protein